MIEFLLIISFEGNESSVLVLLEHGAVKDAKNQAGLTPADLTDNDHILSLLKFTVTLGKQIYPL
jgi:hypothetical protein